MIFLNRYILIADDNEGIIDILQTYVSKEGFSPITASDGEDALLKFRKYKPALILLDVMMPRKNGFEVCTEIRRESNVPIVIITAKGEDVDRIMGLDIGADDYIVKPFSPGEVMARIRAVLRRIDLTDEHKSDILRYQCLEINISEYKVMLKNTPVNLTKKEIEILWLLASNPGKVFSRDNLLNSVWGFDYYGDVRIVDTNINRLRDKLRVPGAPSFVSTVWGRGYKFEVIETEK